MSAFCAAEQLPRAVAIGAAETPEEFASTLSAAIEAREIVPVVVIGPPVRPVPVATEVTDPVPVMLLQPNPVLVVHINAEVAAEHDGIDCAVGTADPAVALTSEVLAPIEGKSPRTNVRKVGVPGLASGEANTKLALSDANIAVSVPEFVTGDPDTVKIPGRESPTDVTVPVPAADCQDGTPEEVSDRTFVPLVLPARLVHPDGPR